MSRSSAATSAGRARTTHRPPSAPPARRVSGPAAPPRNPGGRAPRAHIDASALAYADGALAYDVAPAPRASSSNSAVAYAGGAVVDRYGRLPARRARTLGAPRLAYGGVAIATRVAGVALDVSASRMMDRVVRGRVWIGVIAFSLIGLVAMQVSMLKLNAGIGRAAQTVTTLERSNASLRSDITALGAGDRIQHLAGAQGLVMPAPGEVAYLDTGNRLEDAARAARRMRPPSPSTAGPAGSATPPGLADVSATPMGTTPSATAPATGGATTPGASAPATSAAQNTVPPAPAATAAPTGAATAPAATPTAAPATAPPAAQQQATTPPAGTASGGAAPQATTQTP